MPAERRPGDELPLSSRLTLRSQIFGQAHLIEIIVVALAPGTAIALEPFDCIEQREEFAMLRITTDEGPQSVTLRLEGRLEGPWVAVLAHCWASALAESRGRQLCVDLNGVMFVDAHGKAQLAAMDAQGARFIADDLMARGIVDEILGR